MSRPTQLELLMDLTRLIRKYGRKSFEDLADSLDSPEQRTKIVDLLRAAAKMTSTPKRTASKAAQRRVNAKKVVSDDPERSLEAWSRLIMRETKAATSADESKNSITGRVTFDEHGQIIGSGGSVPSSWKGPIPVLVEVRKPDGGYMSRTIQIEAQDYLDRVARRVSLRDYPEFESK